MNSSRTSKRRTGPQLALGLVTASVLAVGLAVPAHAANTVTNPGVINIANVASYVISGTADPAVKAVVVELVDPALTLSNTVTLPGNTATQQTWSVTIDASTLNDTVDPTGVAGLPLEIFTSYDGVGTGNADATVTKDTVAPEAPTVLPGDGSTFATPTDIFIESLDDQARTRFTFGATAATPTGTSALVPTPPAASHTVATTEQVKAITFDLAGNPSPIMVANYTVNTPAPTPATATTTNLTVSPTSTQVFGGPVLLTAAVTPLGTAGTFEFFDGGTSLGAAATSTTNSVVNPTVGVHSYTAKFTPTNTAGFNASTSAATSFTITAAPPAAAANTTTTLAISPASPQVAGAALVLTATVSPNGTPGTVEYFDGATSLGATGTMTPTVVGVHSFTAKFTPTNTAAFNASMSAATSFTITAAPITPGPITPGPITPGPITPRPSTRPPTATAPRGTRPPAPSTPGPITPGPITPGPITPGPITPGPITPVVTAPKVMSGTPAANATGVNRMTNVMAKFDKNVTGVNGSSFTLRTKSGSAVAAVVTYNPTTRMAMLNPARTLLADTTYVATLSSAVTAGKALAVTRWSFTTGARPTITARTPGVNARGVARAANSTVKFSEKVTGVSGSSLMLMTTSGRRVAAVVSYNRTTRVATLNPSSRLAAGTRYTMVVGNAIKDMAGNRFAATRWSFTTGRA